MVPQHDGVIHPPSTDMVASADALFRQVGGSNYGSDLMTGGIVAIVFIAALICGYLFLAGR